MLTSRQETILRLIVDDYVHSATPVSSESIARKHALGVSPATIRNDVAELEEQGYITRPHSSAGGMPQDKAYRLYVGSLLAMEMDLLSPEVRFSVRQRLGEVERDVEEWTSTAAAALAGLVGNLAITTIPKAAQSRVRHLELVYLRDFLALLIVVMGQARLRRHLIHLSEPTEPSDLDVTASKVKSLTVGLTRRQIEARDMSLSPLEEELVDATLVMLREEEQSTFLDHYLDGLRNLVSQPEYAENDRVRAVVEGVEDGSLAQAVLDEVPHESMVRVTIGQENRGDMLWPLSVVIGRYGVPGEAVGVVGAVGPTRMEYSKTIAGVQLMASVMSELVEGVHDG